jgi:endonuclease-3
MMSNPKENLGRKLIKILAELYPKAETALKFENIFELLVATILSAQCTDQRVNQLTEVLFVKYKKIDDYAGADLSLFEKEIHPVGFFRNKAKNIIKTAKIIKEKFNGRVPDKMEELVKLPGVGRKTANIVLYNGYNLNQGIAVDTHVKRLSQRIGLSRNSDPDKIEQDLIKIFEQDHWGKVNTLLIAHGRRICAARKPCCGKCKIISLCSYKNKPIR